MITPLRFAEVLADPLATPAAIAEAAQAAGPTTMWPASPLLDGWCGVLESLARLGAPTTYVGTFRVALEEAADGASILGDRDRRAAVLLLLQATARHATSVAEFELGLRAAHRVSADALDLSDLLPAVAWACATTADGEAVGVAMQLALPAALSLLTAPGGPWLVDDHIADLHDMLASLPEGAVQRLVPVVERLHPRDRRIVRDAFAPAGRRRLRLSRR